LTHNSSFFKKYKEAYIYIIKQAPKLSNDKDPNDLIEKSEQLFTTNFDNNKKYG